MKFSSVQNVVAGTKAERPIDLPLADGTSFKMLVRPLAGDEEATVLSSARAFAKERGLDAPREGEPLYDLGVMVHTIATACLDPDSPAGARTASFDGGVEQVLKNLNREEIAYLWERQELWQDECSPSVKRIKFEELLDAAVKLAEGEDDLPFVRLRPALRLILVRSLARLVLSSPELRSQFGSPGASTTPTSKTEPEG